MTRKEIIEMIEEMLDVEDGSLNEESILSEIPEYDSMTKLSLIVMCDDEFGKRLTGERMVEFSTIKDILDFIEE